MGATSGAIRAGRAFVELFADDSKLVAGMKAAEAKLQAFGQKVGEIGQSLMNAGQTILAPLKDAVMAFTATGSDLVDMAARTGASVEALSALGFAASQTGTDIGAVETGIKRMQKVIDEATQGAKGATEALARLGLTAADLAGKDADEQMRLIGRAISQIPDAGTRAAAAMEVFGKSGAVLLPMLKDVDALTARAKELGRVMSTEDASAADQFGDLLGELEAALGGVTMAVGSALIPVLTDLAKMAVDITVAVGGWIKENEGLVIVVAAVGAALTAAGLAAIAFGAALNGLATAIATARVAMVALNAVVTKNPIVAVTLALAGLAAGLIALQPAGEKAAAGLSEFRGEVQRTAEDLDRLEKKRRATFALLKALSKHWQPGPDDQPIIPLHEPERPERREVKAAMEAIRVFQFQGMGTTGTFNAHQAGMLRGPGQDTQQRIAQAVERQTEILRRIERRLEGKVAFQ